MNVNIAYVEQLLKAFNFRGQNLNLIANRLLNIWHNFFIQSLDWATILFKFRYTDLFKIEA